MKAKRASAKSGAVQVAVDGHDVHALVAQGAHLVGDGRIGGVGYRNAHGHDVGLTGELPQLIDLAARRAVVDNHHGRQAALFQLQLLGGRLEPFAARVPIRRVGVGQNDDTLAVCGRVAIASSRPMHTPPAAKSSAHENDRT